MKKLSAIIILVTMIFLMLPQYIRKDALASENTYHAIKNKTPDTHDGIVATTSMVNTQLNISSPSVVLMEGSTGTVIYEKNMNEKLRPASITKIMTLLLVFEALDDGQIKLMDEVSISEHAASMGGSQVYLEPYETQNVDTLIKCISIASANDASVAMAEHISGSEEEFVAQMNERSKELGMSNTNFINCCGLDEDNHYTTAYDIALMSRELITKHPQISNYSTIWMDTFVHTTRKGETEFGLTNTNKLIKTYNGITGLKTGSTSLAKYCLSATARKNNMNLISVIMAAPDTKTRFAEAAKLLNYGFANYSLFVDDNTDIVIEPVRVKKGVNDTIDGKAAGGFSYLCDSNKKSSDIQKEIVLYEEVEAPINPNDKIGEIIYYFEDDKIGSIDILSSIEVKKAGFKNCFVKSLKRYFLADPN